MRIIYVGLIANPDLWSLCASCPERTEVDYTLISTSTPEGRSIFISASIVFVVEE